MTTESGGDAERPTIDLFIDDNGPGFQQGMLENIFEPYVSTKRKGSGLGLAIVKKIVEEHGGMISAGSNPEGGARIHIRLQALAQDTCTAVVPAFGESGKSSTGGAI